MNNENYVMGKESGLKSMEQNLFEDSDWGDSTGFHAKESLPKIRQIGYKGQTVIYGVDTDTTQYDEERLKMERIVAETFSTAIEPRLDSIERQLEKVSELLNRQTRRVYSIPVNDLAQNEWKLEKTLMITVEQHSEEDFIACFYDADVYGYGDSIPEALDDLKERLVNQLEFLLEQEKQATLGPIPQKQLDVLRRLIKKGI